jgi:hypothetical protein
MPIKTSDAVPFSQARSRFSELEYERIHLLLLEEAETGMADIKAGRVKDGRLAIQQLRARRQKA